MAKENDELKKKNEQLEEQVKDYELKLDEKVKALQVEQEKYEKADLESKQF